MLESVLGLLARYSVRSATTPAPVAPNDDVVTPGWVGFLVTFFVAAATVLLIIDMVRRIRRTNYRAQVREQIAAEQVIADAEAAAIGTSAGGESAISGGTAPNGTPSSGGMSSEGDHPNG